MPRFNIYLDFKSRWKGYNFVIIRNLLVNILIKTLYVSLYERFHRLDYHWFITIFAHVSKLQRVPSLKKWYVLQTKYNTKILQNNIGF